MVEFLKNEYWTEPSRLEAIRQSLAREVLALSSFSDICRNVSPQISDALEVSGIDNIPPQGPLIAIKNHPCHCDFLLLDSIFEIRPDLRLLAKSSPLTQDLPSKDTILLRKEGRCTQKEDIYAMQAYLRNGGSFLATPWGSMDHQARDYTTPDRAARNAIRYAAFAKAAILPIYIDVEWGQSKQLPVRQASITIQEPITVTRDGEIDTGNIRNAVIGMYERYA